MELTAIDRGILRLLQEDSRCKMDDIANAVGASVATIQRRIRYFKAEGLIKSDQAVLEPELAGQHMTFLILVELERERIDILDEFRRKVAAEERIQQCYYITGEADFALIALAEDMRDYQALIQRLFFDDTNVKRFRTSVVMERTKVGLFVPV